MDPVKIIQLNLNRSTNAAKELVDLVQKSNLDIALLQEPSYVNHLFPSLHTANVVRPPTLDRPRAIIAIFNTAIKFEQILIQSGDICAIKVTSNQQEFLILSVYLPPNCRIDGHLQHIENILSQHNDTPIFISGDSNSSHTLWNSSADSPRGSQIFELIYHFDLTVLTTPNPTYQHNDGRSSYIDITLLSPNATRFAQNFQQLPHPTYSDHTPQTFSINVPKPIFSTQPSTWKFNENNFLWNVFSENFDNNEITSLINDINNATTHENIESCVINLTNIITNTAYKTIPIKKHYPYTHTRNIYRTHEISILHKDTKRFKNKLHKTTNPILKNIYRTKYCDLKKKLTSLIAQQSETDWKNFIQNEDRSPNVWNNTYKFIRNKLKDKIHTTPILSSDRSPEEIVSLANSLFPSDPTLCTPILPPSNTPFSFPLFQFTLLIDQLNPKKAPGPDHITNNMIKHLPSQMISALHQLMLKCLSYGYFPATWRTSYTRIILKPNKTDHFSPSSYRPISLTSHLSKLYEKIVHIFLVRHLESNNLIHHSQHGFRNNKSSISALNKIITDIDNLNHKHKAIISIDFKGAFDNAPHCKILNEMNNLNCPFYLKSIVSHYLNNRNIHIITDHHNIIHNPLGRGCPQGGVLSPTLWNIIMNSLLKKLSETYTCTAYADDLTIIASGSSVLNLALQINGITNTVSNWSNDNCIPINYQKSNVLPIARSPPFIEHMININIVTQSKILGVTFTSNLKFDKHVHNKISQLYKYFNILKIHISHKYGLTQTRRHILYKCLVIPSLLYASEIWSNRINQNTFRTLSTFDNALLRNTLNAYKSTPINTIHLLTNTPLIKDVIIVKTDTYNNIQNLSRTNIFRQLIQQQAQNTINSHMKHLYDQCTKPLVKHIHENNLKFTQTQATTSLLTGHGPTREYLFRIWKIGFSPDCPTCNTPQTYLHIIKDCPLFSDIRHKYTIIATQDTTSIVNKLIKNNTFTDFCNEIHTLLRLHNRHLKYNTQNNISDST